MNGGLAFARHKRVPTLRFGIYFDIPNLVLGAGEAMRRREFITFVAGTAVMWPLAAPAQQQPAKPLIGFLNSASPLSFTPMVATFQDGLNQIGFDSRNVAFEYHWAEGDYDLLPWFAATLVNHKVAAIIAGGGPAALAAKSATTTIPIIFSSRADPIQLGLITALKQPGGNITGVVSMSDGFVTQQIKLIHGVVPSAELIAVLVNPSNPNNPKEISEAREAQALLGIKTTILEASASRDVDAAFAKAAELKVGALVVGADPYFDSHLDKFAALATRFAMPTIHALREFVTSGGLMSYGADLTNAYRLAGIYTGRILKGEKPADLPVQQSTKVELAVNLKTAKTLDVTVPQSVLATADEVIE
jgi:putative tryptophan/tyrosine transport system substrate-binding protein